ncbi:alpha-L-fucosidase-like isoform X2 [Apostichopus japonicus]|uniref:alpha-L-fucosidase-like isoform X2 n=1 Tax=Stichopus japonicus TaxID=307972 RepID=UPI003AB1FE16
MEILTKALILCLAVFVTQAQKLRFRPETKVVQFHKESEKVHQGPYQPNWESIDSRPIPGWYDEAKFGIFMHWGVYSVPAFKNEWFWYKWKTGNPDYVNFMKENYPPHFQYPDFAPKFTAEMFDANHFADVLQASGAQYVVLTSKHHEGFTNYASNFSWNWNSVDLGPNRDLVGEMAEAVRSRTDIKFGLYYSLFEWFHPLYLKDAANNFSTQDYMKMVMKPQLHEIVNKYKPHLIWSDGDWMCPDTYWESTDFLAWLFNESPVKDYIVVNDRWGGNNIRCQHGGYYTCQDRFNPGVLQKHKWENAMTIDKTSWGYRRDTKYSDFLTMDEITQTLAETISCGGNMLMNFGPTHDGRIIPIFEERLRQIGAWLKVNGEGIYASHPWTSQNDTFTPGVWYTTKNTSVYAIVLDWPENNTLNLGVPVTSETTTVHMLGVSTALQWSKGSQSGVSMTIQFPVLAGPQLPCDYAWVLKMDNVN